MKSLWLPGYLGSQWDRGSTRTLVYKNMHLSKYHLGNSWDFFKFYVSCFPSIKSLADFMLYYLSLELSIVLMLEIIST